MMSTILFFNSRPFSSHFPLCLYNEAFSILIFDTPFNLVCFVICRVQILYKTKQTKLKGVSKMRIENASLYKHKGKWELNGRELKNRIVGIIRDRKSVV